MASSLPTPIRVAAGLLGTAADRITNLPEELPALGVSLVGSFFRLSLRVRQEIAALAVRGDELFAGLGGPAAEKPSWATFDEEDGADQVPVKRSQPPGDTLSELTTPTGQPGAANPRRTGRRRSPQVSGSEPLVTQVATAGNPSTTSDTALPAGYADYAAVSLPELKERLADSDLDTVRRLLTFEQSGPGRPAYLTVLGNRIVTLQNEPE